MTTLLSFPICYSFRFILETYSFLILCPNILHSKCRDDEFDLDLEDIMVMEAIWLSIQVIFLRAMIPDKLKLLG